MVDEEAAERGSACCGFCARAPRRAAAKAIKRADPTNIHLQAVRFIHSLMDTEAKSVAKDGKNQSESGRDGRESVPVTAFDQNLRLAGRMVYDGTLVLMRCRVPIRLPCSVLVVTTLLSILSSAVPLNLRRHVPTNQPSSTAALTSVREVQPPFDKLELSGFFLPPGPMAFM